MELQESPRPCTPTMRPPHRRDSRTSSTYKRHLQTRQPWRQTTPSPRLHGRSEEDGQRQIERSENGQNCHYLRSSRPTPLLQQPPTLGTRRRTPETGLQCLAAAPAGGSSAASRQTPRRAKQQTLQLHLGREEQKLLCTGGPGTLSAPHSGRQSRRRERGEGPEAAAQEAETGRRGAGERIRREEESPGISVRSCF